MWPENTEKYGILYIIGVIYENDIIKYTVKLL